MNRRQWMGYILPIRYGRHSPEVGRNLKPSLLSDAHAQDALGDSGKEGVGDRRKKAKGPTLSAG